MWLTARNRLQLDPALRKLGHAEPFIAEGGSGAYLSEDYFHLKASSTIRLGRFTCIPVAARHPAAAEALALLAEECQVTVVPVRSLTARELAQNTGLPRREAESLRPRDFDELFFFAGASDGDIRRFREQATRHSFAVRPGDTFWSLAVHPSVTTCVRELSKLYDRAYRSHALSIAMSTAPAEEELLRACDRSILLANRSDLSPAASGSAHAAPKLVPMFSPDTWKWALEAIQTRPF